MEYYKLNSDLVLPENPEIRLTAVCYCNMNDAELLFVNPITNKESKSLHATKSMWYNPNIENADLWEKLYCRIDRHLNNGMDLIEIMFQHPDQDIYVAETKFKTEEVENGFNNGHRNILQSRE